MYRVTTAASQQHNQINVALAVFGIIMDRPLGPRQPDKRNAAYEDIFGRPGASHHIPPNYQQQPHQYPYPYQQPDKRTSYPHHQPYRQPYYPQQQQQPYGLAPPPQHVPRARSITGNLHINGVIQDPPNSSLESLNPSGLTPAQAYQAQIYFDNTATPQADWNRFQNSPGPSNRHSQNGGSTRPLDPPRIGVSLDHSDGRLGLDFAPAGGNGGSTNSSPQDTDEGSSELPWARSDTPGTSFSIHAVAAQSS
jgi:hypothetical protein